MTFIPFKTDHNRLYIDYQIYKTNLQLREYINQFNAVRHGTFTIDMIQRRVYFYPPDNYVMPPLPEDKPQLKQCVTDH